MIINESIMGSPRKVKCPLWMALFILKEGRVPTREETQLAGFTYSAWYHAEKSKAYNRYLYGFVFNTENNFEEK